MTQGVFENQVITQTLETGNLLTGVSIGTFQEDFPLCEADFLRLKNDKNLWSAWSLNILFTVMGYGMSLLPKLLSEIVGKPEKVTQTEWWALVIGLAVSFVFFLIGNYRPNDKTELLSRMATHFKSAPKTRQYIREQK
ncbi:hypothetical protein [Aeromonas salmonicida]